ncbi:MAG: IclR family transcriptional regulator [Betaproteobacteria bacterium]|nr:IclR family transcriptional regulator [Betaproteobacteria bacterium]
MIEKDRRTVGVNSIGVGMQVLKALAARGGPAPLADVAQAAGMHPAKVHRYLASLAEAGLVQQTGHGRYDLGPYILELSTAYLSRLDPTAVANPMIEKLWSETSEGIILCVWGSAGPTVIRWLQSRRPISVGIRPGAVFSATLSASGHVFLAWLPDEVTRPQVARELEQFAREPRPMAPRTLADVTAIVAQTRRHGLARVTGHGVEYLSALAAPIFDYRGHLVLSLALFGFKSDFDVNWDGDNARTLKRAAQEISAQLGYVAGGAPGAPG